MNNRLKFVISFLIISALTVCALCIPASSYENDVVTSTEDMLLINMDTETVVFSQKPDNMWYAGYLSELMTFYTACENIDDPDAVTFDVEKSYLRRIPESDGSLDSFVDTTLTAKDLMAIMLLTGGSDAAYALADLASDGDIESFLSQMNGTVYDLGCRKTYFSSPGYNATTDHVTCCSDLYRIYKAVSKLELYQELSALRSYTPEGLSEEEYAVEPSASIINEDSPYYFRYTNDALYSYSEKTFAGIVMTTTYKGKRYFFAGLLGLNESERNVFADGRKLATWAYLNLTDRRVVNDDDIVAYAAVNAGWGSYEIPLYAKSSAYKTLPSDFKNELLEYDLKIPEITGLPITLEQRLGSSLVRYNDEQIDDVSLVTNHDEGLGMLSDFARFGVYAFEQVLKNEPADEAAADTEDK